MEKIINITKAVQLSKQLKREGKTSVLVGGCFDILHPTHVEFLQKAKKQADFLFVLLESDKTIQEQKGQNRPIHTQKDRAMVIASMSVVDYVVTLPPFKRDDDYDNLLLKLKPSIIATTGGDPNRHHKERQGELIGAMVIDVMKRVNTASTSNVAKLLAKDYSL